MKKLLSGLVTGLLFFGLAALAQANTMSEFSGSGVFNTYVEDGIVMTNNLGNGMWDAYLNFGGWKGVHLDDGKVTVAMVGDAIFNLKSVGFTWNSAPVDFTFSNGNTYTLDATPNATLLDFEAIGGATGLSWFSIDGNAPWCTQLASIETAPVPEPGTVLLLGAGLLALAAYGKRRKNV